MSEKTRREFKIREVEDLLDGKQVTLASVMELNPNARYLVRINSLNISADYCREIEDYLKAEGLNVIVVSGDFQIFEIVKDQ